MTLPDSPTRSLAALALRWRPPGCHCPRTSPPRLPAEDAARMHRGPEHRQFDSGLGDWVVRDPAGKGRRRESPDQRAQGLRSLFSKTGPAPVVSPDRASPSTMPHARSGTRPGSTSAAACCCWRASSSTARWCLPASRARCAGRDLRWGGSGSPGPRCRTSRPSAWESSTDSGKTWTTVFRRVLTRS